MASTVVRFDAARLKKRLEKLAKLPDALGEKVAEEIDKDMAETYAAEQDPYGTPWQKRVREPKDGHPILDDTGDLKDSRRVEAKRDRQIEAAYDDPKAAFHQKGTRNMVARPLLPNHGIPKRWREAINELFRKSVREIWPG